MPHFANNAAKQRAAPQNKGRALADDRAGNALRRLPQNAAGGKPLLMGLAAVNPCQRHIRNETTRPSPLLVGLGRVESEPTALAAGTAGYWLPAPPTGPPPRQIWPW